MSPRTYQAPLAGDFNPLKVSPSRVNSLLSCGVAFERKYIYGEPEKKSGSAALFGSVVHEALERWCVNRNSDLVALMRAAWLRVTDGDPARDFIGAYASLSLKALQTEAAIREARPEIKVVRMTGDWKKSEVAQQINELMAEWLPKLTDSMWRYRNTPMKDGTLVAELPSLYDESLTVARRYQERWQHLPSALYAELGFDVKWNEFLLNGFIDAVEPVLSPAGEIEAVALFDYKTYAKEPAEHKDWRQVCIYDVAVPLLVERGALELPDVPVYVGVDYVRLTPKPGQSFESRRMWRLTDSDHDRLLRELRNYRGIVEGRFFMPAEKGRNPDFCPYPEDCCLTRAAAIRVDSAMLDQWKAA